MLPVPTRLLYKVRESFYILFNQIIYTSDRRMLLPSLAGHSHNLEACCSPCQDMFGFGGCGWLDVQKLCRAEEIGGSEAKVAAGTFD